MPIICHRVNNDFLKTGSEFLGSAKVQEYNAFGNCIEVCKNRMFGIVDYLVGMYYEIESRRFKNDINENIRYGWQDEPNQVRTPYVEDDSEMFTTISEVPF